MREKPLIFGVETMNIFFREKVSVRFPATDTGSPSPPPSPGYPSTSSIKRYLIGMERSPTALFAPVRIRRPPGNSFTNIVLPESLLLASATRSLRTGVSSMLGARRCLLTRLAISTVGCTMSAGPGQWCMLKPSQLKPISVPPICAPFMKTTLSTLFWGERQSIISRRYGVLEVLQRPGSAEAFLGKNLNSSAHSETVRSGCGVQPSDQESRYMVLARVRSE